ncbi:hypothetical protein [Desulfonema magnum]|uniref:Uncharacterized protein n=1 Tax=Desulfonema magnum TaxID=45655 RepID=A0A975BLB9_9BACT|nr:hypothetical protein [Desulfonema magnum]QTA87228.1 Uncharacterized protein dnm_032580 [Desulfonema magnum]
MQKFYFCTCEKAFFALRRKSIFRTPENKHFSHSGEKAFFALRRKYRKTRLRLTYSRIICNVSVVFIAGVVQKHPGRR